MLQDLKSLILRHTSISTLHLTPEIKLRLITPSSELWRCKPEELPFQDPFWGFYWPGGQAVARYILDEKHKFSNKTVLDIGCGCGAGSIAATLAGAKRVVANDIDIRVLIGDPGRHGLTEKRRKHMTLLSKYRLPENSCLENHGFYETSVWKINKT